MKKSFKLRKLFSENKVVRIVGAHDGLGAKLVERNGFDGVWASGLEISTSYAVPDANILTMSQYLERACEMNDAVDIPIIADCDTGYGNANNVIHMVRKYEAAGIAAVCIEDKLFPKVNSYIPGRQELASIAEFVGKIMAAKNAQAHEAFMVIARVEALIAGWGMEEALRRANDYIDAGADAILIHSKANTPDEIREFCRCWAQKAPLVVVPTTYPMLHASEMEKMGIQMVIYANQGLRASVKAMDKVLSEINKAGDLTTIDDYIVPMSVIFDLQGMRQMKESEKLFLKKDAKTARVIIPAAGDPSYEQTLKDIVKDYPVAMLDINGKSILQRNVEVLHSVNIHDIVVATGYSSHRFNVNNVNYIENKEYKNTSQIDSIMMCADKSEGNTIVAFSDILFEKEIILRLLDYKSDIVLVIDSAISKSSKSIDCVKTETPPIAGERKIRGSKPNRILKIGKNLASDEANFEFVGLTYFSQNGMDILRCAYNDMRGRCEKGGSGKTDFLAVIQKIIDSGGIVSGMEVSGGWMEIRSFENYKLAHSIF